MYKAMLQMPRTSCVCDMRGEEMRQLIAFMKKEWLEQVRSGRLLLLMLLFCLFGIMNPAIAKLTPWMMEMLSGQLAGSGMTIGKVTVDAMTSWVQFYKNIPIALIIFVVMYGGVLTAEYQKGTLINIVTKGMKRSKIVAAKGLVMAAVWTAGYFVSYGITYGYNAYFWDNRIAANCFLSAFCFWLFGLWLISVILSASVLCRSAASVILAVGGAFAAAYMAGLLPALKEYSPSFLMNYAPLLAGTSGIGDYAACMLVTAVLIAVQTVFAAESGRFCCLPVI